VITPAAAAYLKDIYQLAPGDNPKKIPLPQIGNNLVSDTHNTFNYRQEIIRVDHSFNQKLSVFGRYMNDNIPTIEDGGLFDGNPYPNVTTTSTNSPGRSVIVTATMTFTPTFLNDVSYAYSYGAVISRNIGLLTYANSPDIAAIYSQPGILPYATTLNRIPNIGFSNESGIYGFGDYNDFNRNHSIMDNLTKVWRTHTFKFGGQYHTYQKHENAAGPNTGSFSFSGDTLGSEWLNFLTGNPDSYSQASADVDAVIRQHVIELYAQDEWRVHPGLTLSYGVRFSRFGSPYDEQNKATNFVPALYDPSKAPTIGYDGNLCLPTACAGTAPAGSGLSTITPNPNYDPYNGLIGPGVPGHPSPYGKQVSSNPIYFAPRIGLAWDPFGNGKTSIRSGYGMFVDSVAVNTVENNVFTNPPFSQNTNFSGTNTPSGTATLDNPNAGGALNVPSAIGGLAEHWKQPYVQQWSLDIQHELPQGFLVDIGYYGSKGTHLFNYVNINQPAAGTYVNNPAYAAASKAAYSAANGNVTVVQVPQSGSGDNLLNLVRPFQGYNTIDIYEPTFKSNYHSLQMSLQKHFKGNNLIAANYTWSKSLSNLHFPAEYSVPQVTANIGQDYSQTRFSRDHVFNLNFVYALPWLSAQQGLAGHVLGGWEFSGIVQIESGGWVNPGTTNTTDPSGVGIQFGSGAQTGSAALPNQVGYPNSGAPHTATQWFNTAAFADVPSCDPTQAAPVCNYTYGNAKLGSILGPGMQTWDLSLFKNIKFTERLEMQFRAEAFNVFNHTNYSGIDTIVGDSNYGAVVAAHDPRIMQLGLKLNF
jgi:hypothetical protein